MSDEESGLVPLEQAQALVLGRCRELAPRAVAVDDALGCVLAEDVRAPDDIPPFANSSMDGYALRAADTAPAPARLTLVGTVLAGAVADIVVGAGEAMAIMTGAPVPEGADAICIQERTRREGDVVIIEDVVAPDAFVRHAGGDVRSGDVVLSPPAVLGPGDLGLLASVGRLEVCVIPRARVGVLSTGNELTEGPAKLRPGQIRDANRRSLLAQVRLAGCEPVDLGIVGDDEDAIVEAIGKGAACCDALISSGGVSVGVADHVKAALDRLSDGQMTWMQVAIRPAKPFAFGTVAGTGVPLFGLPGNPVSAMVSFELFARPALRLLMGHGALHRPRLVATTEEPLRRRPDGKLHLVRAAARRAPDGALLVRSAGGQDSHQLRAMARANALVLLANGPGVDKGESVALIPLDPESLLAPELA